ncbi:MAG TPA: nucleoside-diphosphate kinase, partial [Candidatus Acetothermia bacterium]|nr:nucleoside-diphosphate kinase [Candidatus Acetothermia bacterium]
DAIQRGLVGRIISRFEDKGFKVAGLKMMRVDEALDRTHYHEHVEKAFFSELLSFITSSPIVAMAIEGENAVEVVRVLMGVTNPQMAMPGTIRGDFGLNLTKNIVHGSDSAASAEREIALFFSLDELHNYQLSIGDWC